METSKIDVALDLMRRLAPDEVENNIQELTRLAPELSEELLSSIDQPLKIRKCLQTGKDYLLCDYNRDATSYRYDKISPASFVPLPKHEDKYERFLSNLFFNVMNIT